MGTQFALTARVSTVDDLLALANRLDDMQVPGGTRLGVVTRPGGMAYTEISVVLPEEEREGVPEAATVEQILAESTAYFLRPDEGQWEEVSEPVYVAIKKTVGASGYACTFTGPGWSGKVVAPGEERPIPYPGGSWA